MKISEIMSTDVITICMDDTVDNIRSVFEQNHCHHLPVVVDNRLVGIISDRDVLRGLCPDADLKMANSHALNTLKKKAHQIMTRDVVTISPDENAEDAATIMLKNKFSCLPVVDELDAICGIVTKTDLLECLCGAKSTSKT